MDVGTTIGRSDDKRIRTPIDIQGYNDRMPDKRLIVVALGGNAISQPHQEGNVDEQFENSTTTARQLADLVEQGHHLVITHGNGPQIGNFMLRNEVAAGAIYPLPMQVAVAHVQGGMGYMIAQTLTNELHRRGQERVVNTFITTILVDRNDPAFLDPSKPVGRVLTRDEVEHHQENGWRAREIEPGKYRRVVPSPEPQRIMEIDAIRRAVDGGDLIVACGGGGIPVVRDPDIGLNGVAAVIDKDLASALLANELDVDTLMFLTAVDRVAIDFGTPDQRDLDTMTLDEARRWLEEGQFPPGSMGPKVQAAINFLSVSTKPDARAIIGPLDRAADARDGKTGTRIVRRPSLPTRPVADG